MIIQNSKNNIAFSGIMIENMDTMNTRQRQVTKNVLSSGITEKNLVKNLEQKKYSDIYISAKPNGNIELKVLHAAGLHYNYIPRDSKGNRLKVVLQRNILKKDDIVLAKVKDFVDKIHTYINRTDEHPLNRILERNYENLSESDLLCKHQRVSRPEFIPDAACYTGAQQVETKTRKKAEFYESTQFEL